MLRSLIIVTALIVPTLSFSPAMAQSVQSCPEGQRAGYTCVCPNQWGGEACPAPDCTMSCSTAKVRRAQSASDERSDDRDSNDGQNNNSNNDGGNTGNND